MNNTRELYHIYNDDVNSLEDGYIGVSKNAYSRFKQHRSKLNCQTHQSPEMQTAYNKDDNIKYKVLVIGEFDYIKDLENKLRPKPNMGWNNMRGGYVAVRDHNEETRNKISRITKGKMPVKDVLSDKIIGSVDVKHPKVISGEWVHVTKGRRIREQERINKRSMKGENNSNYKEMTPERKERLFSLVDKCLFDGKYLKAKELIKQMKIEFVEFNKISHVWLINNFGSFENFITEYNNKYGTNYKFDPYYRGYKKCSK